MFEVECSSVRYKGFILSKLSEPEFRVNSCIQLKVKIFPNVFAAMHDIHVIVKI